MAFDPEVLDLTDRQYVMFDDLSATIADSLGMEKMKVRGFFWRSIKEWQAQQGISIGSVADKSPLERRRRGAEIAEIFSEKMLALIEGEERRQLFRDTLVRVLAQYETDYSERRTG